MNAEKIEGVYSLSEDRIIKALLKKIKVILLVSFVAAGITAIYNIYLAHPVYQANATLYAIGTTYSYNNDKSNTIITSDSISVSQQLVKDYSGIIKSEEITSAVVDKLDLTNISTDKLSKDVNLVIADSSNLMVLSVDNTDPLEAQRIANAFAQIFVQKITSLTKQINISIVQNAKTPTHPIAPTKIKNIALALLISLFTTSGFVILLEYLDNTAHTVEDIEDELGYSVIGIIPKLNIK